MFTARYGLNVYIQFTFKLVIKGLMNGDLFRQRKRDSSFSVVLIEGFHFASVSYLKKRKYLLTSYRGNKIFTDSERLQKMKGNTFRIQ